MSEQSLLHNARSGQVSASDLADHHLFPLTTIHVECKKRDGYGNLIFNIGPLILTQTGFLILDQPSTPLDRLTLIDEVYMALARARAQLHQELGLVR